MLDEVGRLFSATARDGHALHSEAEWQALVQRIADEGLLPHPALVTSSIGVASALPLTLTEVEMRLASTQGQTAQIEAALGDATTRVHHLHALLAEWKLSELSPELTHRLQALVDTAHNRLATSTCQLQSWWQTMTEALGPEQVQSLFWDLLDSELLSPSAALAPTPHAFQRDWHAQIDGRCAQLQVRPAAVRVAIPGQTSSRASAQLPPEAAPPPRIERLLGTEQRHGFRLCVSWNQTRGPPSLTTTSLVPLAEGPV